MVSLCKEKASSKGNLEVLKVRLRRKFTNWEKKNYSDCDIYFAGFFHIGMDLYRNEKAIEYLHFKMEQCQNLFEYETLFSCLNGSWSVIFWLKNENRVILASDLVRSIPLFFSMIGSEIIVSDSTKELVDDLNLQNVITKNIPFYIANKTAPAGETIIENLHDVVAGQFISFDGISLSKFDYWKMPCRLSSIQQDELLQTCNNVFDVVFRRMKSFLDGNSDKIILLPLSGGMDSRLLAWSLKKYNVTNKIIAFSYGRDESAEEARISRMVAEELQLEWQFIKYTKAKWIEVKKSFDCLVNDFPVHKSCIHLQDFLAIREIGKKYPNSIVLPGLFLDHLAGLILPHDLKVGDKINVDLKGKMGLRYDSELANQETIQKNSRLSTWIINSVRTYEYFGLSFYLPFCDLELTNFWYGVPIKYRIERNLFRLYLNKYAYVGKYSTLLGVPVALGRSMGDEIIKLKLYDIIKIKMEFFLRKLGIAFIIKKLIYRKIYNQNRKSDYVGIYDFFDENDFIFDKFKVPYMQLVSLYLLDRLKLDGLEYKADKF